MALARFAEKVPKLPLVNSFPPLADENSDQFHAIYDRRKHFGASLNPISLPQYTIVFNARSFSGRLKPKKT
jgi:hypothetical protein